MHKESLHIRRDPRTLVISLLLPLFQLLLYSYVLTFDVDHIPTAAVDMDHSASSRSLLTAFKSSTYFDLQTVGYGKELDRALTTNEAQVAVVIPPGFGRTLAAGEQAQVQLLVDGSDPRVAAIGASYARAIAAAFSQRVRVQQMAASGIVLRQGFPPIVAERRVWYNPELKSLNYLAPGLIAVIMASLTAVQIASALVVEKEHRTLENLVVSPLRSRELIVGKVVPYLGLAAFQATLVSAVCIFGLGVPFRGSVGWFLLALFLYVATLLGMGLAVSAVARTQQAAQFLAFMVTMLPSFMLSGFIFPIASMPAAVRAVSYLVPPRYFLSILRGVFLKGAPLSALAGDLLSLGAFAVAGIAVAMLLLRRSLR